MRASTHRAWWLILAACLLCAAAIFALWTPRCEAGEVPGGNNLGTLDASNSMTLEVKSPTLPGIVQPRKVGDLDQRIQKQELAMEHAWNAALDARDTYWREQQDWAHGWPSMVHQDRAERYTEILWRRYDKAMRIWQHECRTLVTLYSERRAQSE